MSGPEPNPPRPPFVRMVGLMRPCSRRRLLVPLGAPAASQLELQAAFLQGRELPQPLFLSSAEWLVLLDRAARRRFFTSDKEEQEFVSLLNGGGCLAAG